MNIAATGSEMDTGAVISNMDKNIKSGIMNDILRPRVTFEVPEFTYSFPKYQTACGYEARANLMWASSWAQNSFLTCSIRQMTVCHMPEHELSAFYDITHGHGLAIVTPRWLRYILNDETAKDIYRFGINVMGVPGGGMEEKEGALASIEALEKFFFDTLELKSMLTDLGITDKDFETMADRVTAWGTIQSYTQLTKEDGLFSCGYGKCLCK